MLPYINDLSISFNVFLMLIQINYLLLSFFVVLNFQLLNSVFYYLNIFIDFINFILKLTQLQTNLILLIMMFPGMAAAPRRPPPAVGRLAPIINVYNDPFRWYVYPYSWLYFCIWFFRSVAKSAIGFVVGVIVARQISAEVAAMWNKNNVYYAMLEIFS